jgi:hypothetical protein
MGDAGREHSPLEQSKTPISTTGGAKSDARNAPTSTQDPDLVLVIERWPKLPEYFKATIKTLVKVAFVHICE